MLRIGHGDLRTFEISLTNYWITVTAPRICHCLIVINIILVSIQIWDFMANMSTCTGLFVVNLSAIGYHRPVL